MEDDRRAMRGWIGRGRQLLECCFGDGRDDDGDRGRRWGGGGVRWNVGWPMRDDDGPAVRRAEVVERGRRGRERRRSWRWSLMRWPSSSWTRSDHRRTRRSSRSTARHGRSRWRRSHRLRVGASRQGSATWTESDARSGGLASFRCELDGRLSLEFLLARLAGLVLLLDPRLDFFSRLLGQRTLERRVERPDRDGRLWQAGGDRKLDERLVVGQRVTQRALPSSVFVNPEPLKLPHDPLADLVERPPSRLERLQTQQDHARVRQRRLGGLR